MNESDESKRARKAEAELMKRAPKKLRELSTIARKLKRDQARREWWKNNGGAK